MAGRQQASRPDPFLDSMIQSLYYTLGDQAALLDATSVGRLAAGRVITTAFECGLLNATTLRQLRPESVLLLHGPCSPSAIERYGKPADAIRTEFLNRRESFLQSYVEDKLPLLYEMDDLRRLSDHLAVGASPVGEQLGVDALLAYHAAIDACHENLTRFTSRWHLVDPKRVYFIDSCVQTIRESVATYFERGRQRLDDDLDDFVPLLYSIQIPNLPPVDLAKWERTKRNSWVSRLSPLEQAFLGASLAGKLGPQQRLNLYLSLYARLSARQIWAMWKGIRQVSDLRLARQGTGGTYTPGEVSFSSLESYSRPKAVIDHLQESWMDVLKIMARS